MTINAKPDHKPDLLVLIALIVGLGVLATGVVQAATPADGMRAAGDSNSQEKPWQSLWGLDLARKLKEWRPSITIEKDAEGLNLARPFGKSGPTVQFSSSLPDSVQRSLHAGGDPQVGAFSSDTDLFLFLQKRW
jgi:hypothetical protein